ncbi:MAG: M20/M25/M40 family metallo-hydrolase [Phycisphaeraceae bacterium]
MATHPYENWLRQLTAVPTAAGCEGRVVAWVEQWARRRASVVLRRDRFGNVALRRRGAGSRKPIIFAAHMDHPAFVVTQVVSSRQVTAEFRGGVRDGYFVGAAVRLHHAARPTACGLVQDVAAASRRRPDRRVTVRFGRQVVAAVGDVLTWDTGAVRVKRDRLYAPACDDLAGVAAALAGFDALGRKRQRKSADVRVLLTRAEEVGFVGAIAACGSGIIPRASRIITLESSKSFDDSPIGGGPIVRVGDRTSTFDPDLTYRISRIAQRLAAADPSFRWQRKLMPGGTCEASAYQSFGYAAACLCLPLGNYHNMNEDAGGERIVAEMISLSDYRGLVRLLVAVGQMLDDPDKAPALRARLNQLFATRQSLLS